MVARTGLHTAPVPGSPPVGTSPTDGRLVLGAEFGTAGACLSGGGFTPSGSTMAFVGVNSVWAIPDSANAAAVYHSPVDATTLTPAAGPASGSRIDSIYVLQNDYEKGASDSRVTVALAPGTAGSSPTAPAVPTGALRIANITVPTNASNAAACTLTYLVPPATRAGGGVSVASKALLDLITGRYVGARSYANGIDYRWNGTIWVPWDSDWSSLIPTIGGLNGAYGASPGYGSTGAAQRYVSGLVRYRGQFFLNGGSAAATGQLTIGLPVAMSAAAGARLTGDISGYNNSDANARYARGWTASGSTIYLGGPPAASGKYGTAATASVPFGEAWAQSDSVEWDVTFAPA